MNSGPVESPAGNPLVAEQESIAFIGDRLDTVGPSSAKEEQGTAKRIELHAFRNDGDKPVNAFAQVCSATCYIDVVELRYVKIVKHPGAPS